MIPPWMRGAGNTEVRVHVPLHAAALIQSGDTNCFTSIESSGAQVAILNEVNGLHSRILRSSAATPNGDVP